MADERTVSQVAKGRLRRHWFRCGPGIVQLDEFATAPVFDPFSGETHVLTDLPLLLLSVIDNRPREFEDLVREIGGDDLDDDALARLRSTLLQLEQVELIESELRSVAAG